MDRYVELARKLLDIISPEDVRYFADKEDQDAPELYELADLLDDLRAELISDNMGNDIDRMDREDNSFFDHFGNEDEDHR